MARLSLDRPPEPMPDVPPRQYYRRERKPLRKRIKFACCLVFLFLIFGLGLISIAAIAKTGIWQIPLFSDIFYKIPSPDRLIEVKPQDINTFAAGLKLKSLLNGVVSLEISEKELTFILQELLTTGTDPYFASNLQANIFSDRIEVFGLLLKPIKTNLTLKIKPQVVSNHLDFEIQEIKAGDLSIPPAFIKPVLDIFLKGALSKLNEKLSQFGEIQGLELADGKIVITGKLKLN